jgi:ferritin
MINEKLVTAFNEQINKELYSEYLYLSMAVHLANNNLDGFANFMFIQAQEEHFHAMKMIKYLLERGGKVQLKRIDEPKTEFDSVTEIFELAWDHEKFISESINKLMDLAIGLNDHSAKGFLQWYVDEQVEEEASMEKIVNKLHMIKDSPHGLMMIDSQLAQRVFTPAEDQQK